jgi:hypothetical protein
MSKARSTGNLNNSIVISDTGAITFVSGSTTLATLNTAGQLSGSTPVVFAATSSFANAFTVAGTLTAQTLVVQTITSSIDFVTGSTRFGSTLANTHVFSGSVTMNPGGLFVSSSGNVGIGTSSPSDILDVQKNQNATTNFYLRNTSTTDTNSRAYLNIVSGNTTLQLKAIHGDNVYMTPTTAVSQYLGYNNLVVIDSSGNIGMSGTSFGLGGNTIRSKTVSSISGTYTTIGYAQTYGNMFWIWWNDSNGTTDYALVGCIWYPGTVNVIASTNNGGHGVTFQMSGQYLQMRAASGTVGPVITLQIGN